VGYYQIKIGIVIPARLESERLPRKVLKMFSGLPMIEHVWRRAQLTNPVIETVIATDSEEIKKVCENFGAKCYITSKNHPNGLSRISEVSSLLNWDFYIVLQADEILIDPDYLSNFYRKIQLNLDQQFFNLVTKLQNNSELSDKNVVKCLIRTNETIINLFRISGLVSPIEKQLEMTRKICGIYAISSSFLSIISKAKSQKIEISESIEQMKVIELGINILAVNAENNYPSVNTPEEALRVQNILITDTRQKQIFESYSK
jgi:3-deoxy-manno-octulosonate cytidylyltransferase (CMP-KDO synthetase)